MTGAGADRLAALLDGARRAAVEAGDAIRAIAAEGAYELASKTDDSPLTRADLHANRIIATALHALDPGAPVISEEDLCTVAGGAPRRFWLVDPLDGTREFLAGNGEYTVNVALIEDGVPLLGVVHAPVHGTTYAACAGLGATRTDATGTRTIRADASGPLVVVASRSHGHDALAAFLAALPPHRTVAMGSSLKICLVAEGAAHLYPRLGTTCWWDTAAAHAIALEAGATIGTLDGSPLRYDGCDVRNPAFVCSSLARETWAAAADAVRAR
jgi:3'(2'), 5'-bisphosphate nucleotidase